MASGTIPMAAPGLMPPMFGQLASIRYGLAMALVCTNSMAARGGVERQGLVDDDVCDARVSTRGQHNDEHGKREAAGLHSFVSRYEPVLYTALHRWPAA